VHAVFLVNVIPKFLTGFYYSEKIHLLYFFPPDLSEIRFNNVLPFTSGYLTLSLTFFFTDIV